MKNLSLLFSIFLFCFFTFSTAQQTDIEIELFSSGFNRPIDLQNAGDNRIFVVEQGGKIKVIQEDGSINTTPFLDISSSISTGGERGLLGLAFHPDYQNNGYFYVNYTNLDGDTRVTRYSVDPNNPHLSLPNSDLPIIGYEQPASNHNGGHLLFGPDGYLYIASGDGGGSGDPNNNSQNINNLLGKILRIDVDNPSGGENYGIPADNPFVGNPNAREEIWAYGLRNPWRFTIDQNLNDIIIADVGQNQLEEINWESINLAGVNYGWRCYEGSQPYNTANCPPVGDLTFPFAEYPHTNGNCSITGGLVREVGFPNIQLLYFFADYCSGLIGSVDYENGEITEYGNFSGNWVSFGEDDNENLYIIDITAGDIYLITPFTLSTEDFTANSTLSIFPNPATDRVFFQSRSDAIQEISIYDLKGVRILHKTEVDLQDVEISASGLSKGLYIAEVLMDHGKIIQKKLIIQ